MRWRCSPRPSARAACGRSAPATPARASPTRRARPACRARSWRSRPRRPPSSSACRRSARSWCWCPTRSPGRRWRSAPIPASKARFVHPFDDHNFIAGHATMGLEILEDAPDTAAVIAGIGGGGLITGVGSALKALKPDIKVWGAEPETAAPAALSFASGSPQTVPGVEGLVRRRRRRPERVPAHVGADEAAGRRQHRRHARADAARRCG